MATGLVLATACHGERTRPAPYRSRPDSVKAGTLKGPFSGKVVDAASGDPIAGALVYATWTFERGYGMKTPGGFQDRVTSTDATGHYAISGLETWPTAKSTQLTSFHLVIYKRGYVAYRSDRRFNDLGPRMDFTQRQNEVVLERWRSDYSHVRHLRYVGGGAAIASLTAWEADEAAAELSGRRGMVGPRLVSDIKLGGRSGGVVAAQLLSVKDIKEVTGFDGNFERGPLNDEPDTDAYSSQHFRALGQPETYDLAVRVWKLDDKGAAKRYAELADSLPGVEKTNEIADKSLRALEGDIHGTAFLDDNRDIVVLITCGASLCSSAVELATLAKRAHDKIDSLSPRGSP